MPKYKITCYPTVDSYTAEVEASSKEEAIEVAEEEANRNTGFTATENDVEELD